MAINPALWYTTFQAANQPGRPMASMAPTQMTQPASVIVTPNNPPAASVTALPQGANPYQRAIARQMMATGASTAPVQSPLEGLARALTGLGGGYLAGQVNQADTARQTALGGRLASLAGIDPQMAEGLTPEQVLGVAQLGGQSGETWRQLTPSEATSYGVPSDQVWQISNTGKLRKPGAAGTTIQLPGEPREKFTDTLSKVDAERYEAWAGEADTAASQIGSIRRARNLLDEGLATGRVTALTAPFGEFMAGFGIDPEAYGLEDASDVAEFTAIANRMTTDLTSQLKGALSDRELRFLERANISISNTPEANRAIMDMLEKGAQRKVLRLEAADEWLAQYGDLRTKNDNDLTFQQSWNRYLRDNETIPETVSGTTEETETETMEADVSGNGGSAAVTVESVRTMPMGDLRKVDIDTLSNEALDAYIERLSGGE